MGLFGKKKEAEPIQQTTPAITHDGMYFEFHSAGKVDWTLSEDALTIVKKSLLATPGTYKLADITNVRHESHKGKFMPSNIFIKVSNGKEQQLCYFDEERQYGEQAYQYLVEHCGGAEKLMALQAAQKAEQAALLAAQKAEQAMIEKLKTGVEIRKRCNVCGNVFCFNYQDYIKNQNLAKQADKAELRSALSGLAGGLNMIGGSALVGSSQSNQMENAQSHADILKSQIRDFNRCPNCNSSDLTELTDEEFKAAIAAKNAPVAPAAAPSVADELKKFKELLDLGAITQEEFDAKKKQLLGL